MSAEIAKELPSADRYLIAANVAAASLPLGVVGYLSIGVAILFLPQALLSLVATVPFVIGGAGFIAALVALWGYRRLKLRSLLVKALLGLVLPLGYGGFCMAILIAR
jgi:hypothetical protein